MTGPSNDPTRVAAADAAAQTRAVLASLADPDDELTASAATCHRLEGAALALEAITGQAARPSTTPAAAAGPDQAAPATE